MDITEIIATATAVAVALSGLYWAIRKVMRVLGDAIPGKDPVEKADEWLAANVDDIVEDLDQRSDGSSK